MTEYKTGDRVRVQIDAEGTVAQIGGYSADVCIDGQVDSSVLLIPVEYLTLIRQPLKPHDEIAMGVDPEPPRGTVLVYPNGAIVKHLHSGWAFATFGSGPSPCYDWRDLRGLVAHTASVAVLPDGA